MKEYFEFRGERKIGPRFTGFSGSEEDGGIFAFHCASQKALYIRKYFDRHPYQLRISNYELRMGASVVH
jgi:hypothetical protein